MVLREQCDTRVDGVDLRRRHAGDAAELDDGTDQCVGFDTAARFDVLQHRGLVRAHGLCTRKALLERNAEADAEGFGHRLSFLHHPHREFARRSISADVLKRSMRQRADGIEAEVAPELDPELAPDVGNDRRLEAGLLQGLGNALRPLGLRVVDLGDGEAVALDVLDDARLGDFGGRVNDAAEHAIGRQIVGDDAARIDALEAPAFVLAAVLHEVPPGDAVLRREHDRIRSVHGRQVTHDGAQPGAPSCRE